MSSMRVIVTGSRDWLDQAVVWRALGTIASTRPAGILTIVHGACPSGADEHASEWVARHGRAWATAGVHVIEERHPADWRRHGRKAGPLRNTAMVGRGADLVLAYVRNHSRGSMHTVTLARAAGIEVRDSYLCTHAGPCPTPTPAARKETTPCP